MRRLLDENDVIDVVRNELKRNPTMAIRTMEAVRKLPSAQPEHGDEAAFWEKRAREYEDMIYDLIAEQAKGIKFDSIKITREGVVFKKSQPERKMEH